MNGRMDKHFYTWLSVCIPVSKADFSPTCVCARVHAFACAHACLHVHMELAASVISMHAGNFGNIYLQYGATKHLQAEQTHIDACSKEMERN